MTALVVSLAYDADVERKGRRRESREAFRHDVPIEIRELPRKELAPAVRIVERGERTTLLGDPDGGLWGPFVPPAEPRRVKHQRPKGAPAGGAAVERAAQPVADFVAAVAGRTPMCRDPLERRRSALQDHDLSHLTYQRRLDEEMAAHATRLPRIEESDVRRVLWSERPAAEARLRCAAEDLLVVDGRIWCRLTEPALAMNGHGGERRTAVSWAPPHWHALSEFRLDRMDDLVAWAASRQGIAAIPPKGRGSEVVHDVEVAVLRPEALRRDDARELLAARLHPVLYASAKILAQTPARGVDLHVDLKRFLADPAGCALPTPDLYARLAELGTATEAMAGLDRDGFTAREQVRSEVSPLLQRWNAFEIQRYPAPDAAPAPGA